MFKQIWKGWNGRLIVRTTLCALVFGLYSTLAISENEVNFDPETNTLHIPAIKVVGDASGKLYSAEMTSIGDGAYYVKSVIELPPTDFEIEERVSISQGIYGLTTSQDDVGSYLPVLIFPGFKIEVFYETQLSDFINEEAVPIASAESDDRGFYELELQPGYYCVCTTFRRCVGVFISENETQRLDYEFSVGPGWHSPRDQNKCHFTLCRFLKNKE